MMKKKILILTMSMLLVLGSVTTSFAATSTDQSAVKSTGTSTASARANVVDLQKVSWSGNYLNVNMTNNSDDETFYFWVYASDGTLISTAREVHVGVGTTKRLSLYTGAYRNVRVYLENQRGTYGTYYF